MATGNRPRWLPGAARECPARLARSARNHSPPARTPSFHSQRLSADRVGGGGGGDSLLSRFRARRCQQPEQPRPDPADRLLAEVFGREDAREEEQEGEHASREVAAAAAAAAAAVSVGGGVDGGAAVADKRAGAPAKYDGEEVLPETWAKV